MDRLGEMMIVPQHHFSIIAPEYDVARVTHLVTAGMYPCFGLGLYDPVNKVGLFGHIDNDTTKSIYTLIEQSTPFLRTLGAENLYLETVNLYGYKWVLEDRHQVLRNLIKRFNKVDKKGFQIRSVVDDNKLNQWVDKGVSEAAIFDVINGIQPLTDDAYWDLLFSKSGKSREEIFEEKPHIDPLEPIRLSYAPQLG